MRTIIILALGAILGGGVAFAGLKSLDANALPAAKPVIRGAALPAFEVERSEVHTIASRGLGRAYQVYVKLPPSYGDEPNRRYPVLYLTDGPYTFQVASGVTRVPYNHKRLEEAILVGISYGSGEDPADNRRRDMTPWPDRKAPESSGGAAAYLAFLKDEVMPLVEDRYRVDAKRRVLVGQSYGALFGAWVALNQPQVFSAYVLSSPSLWYAKREMFRLEQAYAGSHQDLKARIFMATGEKERASAPGDADMVADQAAFAQALKERGYPGLELRSEVIPGSYHETTFPTALTHALQWLYLRDPKGS